jgi:hypothetical protein
MLGRRLDQVEATRRGLVAGRRRILEALLQMWETCILDKRGVRREQWVLLRLRCVEVSLEEAIVGIWGDGGEALHVVRQRLELWVMDRAVRGSGESLEP